LYDVSRIRVNFVYCLKNRNVVMQNAICILSLAFSNVCLLLSRPPMQYDIALNYKFPLYGQEFTTSKVSNVVSRDSSVGIAARYGLDGPWIESR
jgi:hypothetical protein